jgi:proline iminopeptidase
MSSQPSAQPFETFHLPVGDGHELYVERVGTPGGIPALVLHGGPGAGASAALRGLFDPQRFSVTLFDQRGALRSRPLGSLEANTTAHLVEDIVRLRMHLGIARWIVVGGSWGVALALAYAAREPGCVAGLVLRGIYLGRRHEDLWQYQEGASRILPDAWEAFLAAIPRGERGDLISAYHRRLTGSDAAVRLAAARAFLAWGVRTNSLLADPEAQALIAADYTAEFVVATARIAAHYAVNRSFFPAADHILKLAAKLPPIRTALLHGRYDLAVPLRSALDLKAAMPWAQLKIVEGAGHAAAEPAMARALAAAITEKADAFASA